MTTQRSKTKRTRQPHQRKPDRTGIKSLRGVPEIYDEVKQRTTVALTPTAIAGLDEISKAMGISRSELIERIGRQLLKIAPCNPEA